MKYVYTLDYFYVICEMVVTPLKIDYSVNNCLIYDSMFNHIKATAKIRKKFFNLNKKYVEQLFLEQNGKCLLTGQIITLPKNYKQYIKRDYTASLDRIDSNLGYIKNNVRWIHKHINKSKINFSDAYYKYMCELVVKNRNIKNETI